MNKPLLALLVLVCVSLACVQGGASSRSSNLPQHCVVRFSDARPDENFDVFTTLIKDGSLILLFERPSLFESNNVKVFNMSDVAGYECTKRGAQ